MPGVADGRQRFSGKLLVDVSVVDFGGIERPDALVVGLVDHTDAVGLTGVAGAGRCRIVRS